MSSCRSRYPGTIRSLSPAHPTPHAATQLKAQMCFPPKSRRAPAATFLLSVRAGPSSKADHPLHPCKPASPPSRQRAKAASAGSHHSICRAAAHTLVNHTRLSVHAVQFGDVSLPKLTSRLYYSHLKNKTSSCNSEIISSDSKEKAGLRPMLWALLHSKMLFTDLKEA